MSMHITLNGTEHEIHHGAHLNDVLKLMQLAEDQAGVAVARNNEVVPRAAWSETIVKDGDRIEIVTAAQGG